MSSAVRCRGLEFSRISRIRMRGCVTLRPTLRRSCDSIRPSRVVATRVLQRRSGSVVYHPAPVTHPFRTMPTMRKTWTPLLFATFLFTGCGIVYHQPIYQGNLLESKNVDMVKPGMSKSDVLVLLGTPSVADPFHASRWDYVA